MLTQYPKLILKSICHFENIINSYCSEYVNLHPESIVTESSVKRSHNNEYVVSLTGWGSLKIVLSYHGMLVYPDLKCHLGQV